MSLLSAAPGRRWWGCSPRPLHAPPPRSLVIPASLRLRPSELLWEPTRCRCLRGTCGWCPGSQSEAAAASVGREGTRQTGRVAAPPGAAGPREAGEVPWRAEAPGGLSSGRLTVVAAVLSVCWFPPLAVLPLAQELGPVGAPAGTSFPALCLVHSWLPSGLAPLPSPGVSLTHSPPLLKMLPWSLSPQLLHCSCITVQ